MEKAKGVGFSVLLSLCSLSTGFGVSQLSLSQTVHVTAANQTSILREFSDMKKEWQSQFDGEKNRSDQRTYEMRQLVTSVLNAQGEQTKLMTELVTLIKVQNQVRQ